MNRDEGHRLWREFVNPEFITLLETLDFGRCFTRASGTRLYDETGAEYLDCLAGFGVHNIGHNHPRVIGALHQALKSQMPSMLNVDAPMAIGALAARLTRCTHPSLCRTTFANSGAEAVDVAIKAARAATGRRHIISCTGAYHGLSVGAMSLMDTDARQLYGCDADSTHVEFGDLTALDKVCAEKSPAAFIVEPIQAEGGIRVPDKNYLRNAECVCRTHGCLLIVDEIQTGFGRTGRLFATPFSEVIPDILVLGKGLSGGLVPVAATLMSAEIWSRGFGTAQRCRLNSSTFAGGHLAMVAGLETLDVIESEDLAARADQLGEYTLSRLRELAGRHLIIKSVRGRGLLIGVEFNAPSGLLMHAIPGWARAGLLAHVVAAKLLSENGILAEVCSLAHGVLRFEPPLIINTDDAQRFVSALDHVLERIPSHNAAVWQAFWHRLQKGKR
ncbi:MAG TPA: aspartate aminotransferase family protein [Planctomycetota bacterium]|jgi:putrescine aminotransferase